MGFSRGVGGEEDGQKSFLYSSSQSVPQNLSAWKEVSFRTVKEK